MCRYCGVRMMYHCVRTVHQQNYCEFGCQRSKVSNTYDTRPKTIMAAPPPAPSCQNSGHTSLTDALWASSTAAAARFPSPAAATAGRNTGLGDRYTPRVTTTTVEERRRFVVDVLSAAIAIAEEVTRDVESGVVGADEDDNVASRDASPDSPSRPRQ
jgi:hypothetical protein